LRCLIVDDEPLASDVIENYINKIESLNIVAKCNSALKAINILKEHQIDLIFLDIKMPNLSGLELVKTIDNIPQFIFTTAYSEHAIEGFELNATDYLVKPIRFNRFIKAVNKAQEKHELKLKKPIKKIQDSKDYIFIKSEYENIKVNLKDIQYIEGLKDYVKIHIKDSKKSLLTLSSFKNILGKLSPNFIRIHRSYIVNIDFIKTLQKTKVIIGEVRLPIGESYKESVLKHLGV